MVKAGSVSRWQAMGAAVVATVCGAAALRAGDHEYHTAQGVAVETPAVATLDCPTMRAVLDAIDRSGYRGLRPEPLDGADRSLLDYENQLSAHFYATCVSALTRSQESSTAFAHGFRAESTE